MWNKRKWLNRKLSERVCVGVGQGYRWLLRSSHQSKECACRAHHFGCCRLSFVIEIESKVIVLPLIRSNLRDNATKFNLKSMAYNVEPFDVWVGGVWSTKEMASRSNPKIYVSFWFAWLLLSVWANALNWAFDSYSGLHSTRNHFWCLNRI